MTDGFLRPPIKVFSNEAVAPIYEPTKFELDPVLGVEVPFYGDEPNIVEQNDRYALSIVEEYGSMKRTEEVVNTAIICGFILGAGGPEGSFDAAAVLEIGGFELLLSKLGLSEMDDDFTLAMSDETFAAIARASVAWGPQLDFLGDEIPDEVAEASMAEQGDILGPLTARFVHFL